MGRFIILRDTNAPFRSMRPRIGFGPQVESFTEGPMGAMGDVPPSPSLEIAEMSAVEAHRMQNDPSVAAVARDMPTRLIAPMNEGADTAQATGPTWGVSSVGADTSPFDGAGIRVAVLDTGIDADHPAFAGVTLTEKDFSGAGNGDPQGHGTHCAGTVFGRDVDGARIGVAPGVTDALIGKVLGDDGSGSSTMLFDGMKWAFDNGARVMSMSLGFDFPGLSQRLVDEGFPVDLATSISLEAYRMNLRVFDRMMAMFDAMAAFSGGSVVVAASGNESKRDEDPDYEVSVSVPAVADGIVSVGALAEAQGGQLSVAPFSNTNPSLSAPGVDVVSAATGGGLVSFNGTSMATPHVAGLAALWWQALSQAPVPQSHHAVKARLVTSARTDVFTPGTDIADRGHGLAQAPSAALS